MFGPGVRRDSDFNECSVFSLSVFLVVWFVVRLCVRSSSSSRFKEVVCLLCVTFPSPSFQVLLGLFGHIAIV